MTTTQEQQFNKLEEEVNSPLWIKQSEYYKKNNKVFKFKKVIYGVELLVHSDGHIFRNDVELPQYDNNKGYKMININDKKLYVHHVIAWTFLYKDIKAYKETFNNEKYEINHRDNNNQNNNINNLFICNVELNRLNKKKYKGKCTNNFKGVYKVSLNNKPFEIDKKDDCDITKDGIIYKVVFMGKFVNYTDDEEKGAKIYDKMLISYIMNKYGSLSLINDNVLNDNNNIEEFKNEFMRNSLEEF